MRVVNPDNIEHTIQIIPRDYNMGTTVMTIINEVDRSVYEPTHTVNTDGNFVSVTFTLETTEGSKYSFKISDETGTLYRGRLMATSQETQEYNLTTKYYSYE